MVKSCKRSTTKNNLKCIEPNCSKQFKYKSVKKRHEESHYTNYECALCRKRFNFSSALKRHEKQHQRTRLVTCILCDHNFLDSILLKRHMEYAHQGKSHACKECGAVFGSDKALKIHTKTHQPEAQRRFCCSHVGCNKVFSFSHHLKHHELTHTNIKQHYCSMCGKGFIQLHHLKTHLKKHYPDQWISCSITDCKKQFTNEYALKRHLKIHAKHNPASVSDFHSTSTNSADNENVLCDYCGNLITRKYLTKHIKECSLKHECDTSSKIYASERPHLLIPENRNTNYNEKEIVLLSSESSTNKTNEIEIVNSCTNAIGGCIVSGDTEINENCLCIQISPKDDFTEEVEKIVTKGTAKNSKFSNQEIIYSCEDCNCSDVQGTQNILINTINKKDLCNLPKNAHNTNARINENQKTKMDTRNESCLNYDLPECVNENTVKEDNASQKKKHRIDLDSIPFNSCKAILGNCIVSGDQTIGEGCLCAKMSNSIHETTEDIEEISQFSAIVWCH